MEPEYIEWLRENMPKDLFDEMESENEHNLRWRDELIAELRDEIEDLTYE